MAAEVRIDIFGSEIKCREIDGDSLERKGGLRSRGHQIDLRHAGESVFIKEKHARKEEETHEICARDDPRLLWT